MKAYSANPRDKKIALIFKSQQKTIVENEIKTYIIKGLEESIYIERNKRKHSTRLNLAREEINRYELQGLKKIQKVKAK